MRMKRLFTGLVAVFLLLGSPTGVFALDSLAPISTATPTTTDLSTLSSTMPTATQPLAALDTTAPTVSVLTLTGAAVAGTSVQFTASVSDNVAVTSCSLWATNSSKVTTKTVMTLTTMATGQVAGSITAFKDAGKYMTAAVCSDAAGNSTRGTSLGVIVVAAASTPTPVDTTAPIVGAVTPTTATVGVPVTFSSVVSDDVSVAKCSMTVTTSAGISATKPMTLVTTAAGITSATSLPQTYSVADTLSVIVSCSDSIPNRGSSTATSVTVSTSTATTNPIAGTAPLQTQIPSVTTDVGLDTTAPAVGIISPLVATVGVTQKFSASVTEGNTLASCALSLTNSVGTVSVPMTVTAMNIGYDASVSYAFKNTGSFGAIASCKDGAGNEGKGKSVTVVVSAATSQTPVTQTPTTDTTTSTVGPVSPLVAEVGTEVALTSSVSSTITTCALKLTDGSGATINVATTVITDLVGAKTAVGKKTFGFAGKYDAVMTCVDTAKKITSSTLVTVVVSQKGSTTTTAPGGTAPSSSTTTQEVQQPGGTAPTQQTPVQQVFSVGPLTSGTAGLTTDLTATAKTSIPLSAAITGASSLTGMKCTLYFSTTNTTGTTVGGNSLMTVNTTSTGGSADISFTFTSAGTYTAFAQCIDALAKKATGQSVNITVGAAIVQAPVFSIGAVIPITAIATIETQLMAPIMGLDTLDGTVCTLSVLDSAAVVITDAQSMMTSTDAVTKKMSASTSFTFKNAGTYTASVTCKNGAGVVKTSAASTITVGASQKPASQLIIGSIVPITAIVGMKTQLVAPITGALSLDKMVCTLSLTTAGTITTYTMISSMDATTKKMSAGYIMAFSTAGEYAAQVTCVDSSGSAPISVTNTSTTITVSAAQTPIVKFTVGTPVPVTAVVGTAVAFLAPITGATALTGTACTLSIATWTLDASIPITDPTYVETYILGSATTSNMTVAADTSGKMSASASYTFGAAGQYKSFVTCTAMSGTTSVVATSTPSVTVTVGNMKASVPSTTSSTTGTFKVGTVVPLVAIAGTATTFLAPIIGAASIEGMACTLSLTDITTGVEGVPSAVLMSIKTTDTGSAATADYTFQTAGSYAASVSCTDASAITVNNNPVTIKVGKAAGVGSNGSVVVDKTAPVIGSLSPVTTMTGASTAFTFSATDDAGESGLTCFIGLSLGRTPLAKIPATVASGVGTAAFKFITAGAYSASVLCSDIAQNHNVGVPTDVVVTDPIVEKPPAKDIAPPVVGKVTPTSAIVGTPVTIGAIASDIVGVTSCTFIVNGVDQGAMTMDNGSVSALYTFTKSGDIPVVVSCLDAAGNIGKSKSLNIRVMDRKDVEKPIVGTIPLVDAIAGAPVILTATYSDNVGVASCALVVDGKDGGQMALGNNGTTTATTTFETEGTHTAYAVCTDTSGNIGSSTEATTFQVSVISTDIISPVITGVTATSTIQNTTAEMMVSATDESGIASCNLFVNDVDQGPMTENVSGVTFTRSYTFADSGTFMVYAQCSDSVGNVGVGSSTILEVSPVAGTTAKTDDVDPTVSAIEVPEGTVVGEVIAVTAVVADSTAIASCELYVDSVDVGAMTVSADGTASYLYTVPVAGTTVANAYCVDTAGNATQGASTLTTVEEAPAATSVAETITNPDAGAVPGGLIKLACYTNSGVNDPCRAVYFYSKTDGQRHVFTNERSYFTWYGSWDNVTVVSEDFMSSVMIGKNVVYRPGAKLVKFDSSNRVYVVTKGGVLREVPSEAMAGSLYGSDWNTKIDVISDAFFGNYTFGEPLAFSTDFNPSSEQNAVTAIDENVK